MVGEMGKYNWDGQTTSSSMGRNQRKTHQVIEQTKSHNLLGNMLNNYVVIIIFNFKYYFFLKYWCRILIYP